MLYELYMYVYQLIWFHLFFKNSITFALKMSIEIIRCMIVLCHEWFNPIFTPEVSSHFKDFVKVESCYKHYVMSNWLIDDIYTAYL